MIVESFRNPTLQAVSLHLMENKIKIRRIQEYYKFTCNNIDIEWDSEYIMVLKRFWRIRNYSIEISQITGTTFIQITKHYNRSWNARFKPIVKGTVCLLDPNSFDKIVKLI